MDKMINNGDQALTSYKTSLVLRNVGAIGELYLAQIGWLSRLMGTFSASASLRRANSYFW